MGGGRHPTCPQLGCAQRFGNCETCIAGVQICGINRLTIRARPARNYCTGTFSLKISRGSMNFFVR
ncbi:MAG: hypothetical protein E5X48_14550 [Mesorhizobium sp.]|nr:MAG: hypothetical protein E5X48_14550 [Mesorhizobium sp.]